MQPHVVFCSPGITQLVRGIVPMGFSPPTPSFTNLSLVDAPDPLTGHSDLIHTLHIFLGTRALTWVQNIPLPPTRSSTSLSSSVWNLMRRHPIQTHLPA